MWIKKKKKRIVTGTNSLCLIAPMESASTLELNVSLHGHVISYAKLTRIFPHWTGIRRFGWILHLPSLFSRPWMGPGLFGKEEMIHSLHFSSSEKVLFTVKSGLLDQMTSWFQPKYLDSFLLLITLSRLDLDLSWSRYVWRWKLTFKH